MSFLSQQKNENKNKAEEKLKKKRQEKMFGDDGNTHSSDTVYGFFSRIC